MLLVIYNTCIRSTVYVDGRNTLNVNKGYNIPYLSLLIIFNSCTFSFCLCYHYFAHTCERMVYNTLHDDTEMELTAKITSFTSMHGINTFFSIIVVLSSVSSLLWCGGNIIIDCLMCSGESGAIAITLTAPHFR